MAIGIAITMLTWNKKTVRGITIRINKTVTNPIKKSINMICLLNKGVLGIFVIVAKAPPPMLL